ncbi:hypothetical protein CC2G_000211 [Coprinopsis cinerea AmutBmut pab1-1]|nr:hypothetical protein CC2G_000211 [Coprinopsis cinerea AmutBmut pab1-1]
MSLQLPEIGAASSVNSPSDQRLFGQPSPLEETQPGLLFPIPSYTYPWGQCAAISRLFTQQVLTLYGANQATIMVAILVPDDQLDIARELLVKAGLEHCTCSEPTHLADKRDLNELPVHLKTTGGVICLCPSSILEVVPLRYGDPDPLNVSFNEYLVHLKLGGTETWRHHFEKVQPNGSQSEYRTSGDLQVVRLLDPRSIVAVHILHHLRWTQGTANSRVGIGLRWMGVLNLMVPIVGNERVLDLLPEGEIREYYAQLKSTVWHRANVKRYNYMLVGTWKLTTVCHYGK